MNREPMSSSNVASAGYDSPSQTLEIEFLDGSIYQYYNVEEDLFNQFCLAPSKGKFLHAYIKNAYPYSRVG